MVWLFIVSHTLLSLVVAITWFELMHIRMLLQQIKDNDNSEYMVTVLEDIRSALHGR